MSKMKLGALVNPSFKQALSSLSKQPLPLKASFKLKTIMRKVQEEISKYDECRKDALKNFGEKDENGNVKTNEDGSVVFAEGQMDLFVADLEELLSQEVEVETLSVSELGNSVNISTTDLFALEGLLVE